MKKTYYDQWEYLEKGMMKMKEENLNDRANVIWIFGDQHRAQALSCNGDPNLSTPNLDILSANGVNFTQAVAGFPLCCPFRGSLLSGRYPHKCVPGHEYRFPADQPTVATVFNGAGYKTAYFGKWHLDGFHEREGRGTFHIVPPERRGDFQEWIGYENNNSQWDTWVHGGEGEDAFHYRLPAYETDSLTDLMIDYIKEQGEEQRQGNDLFFAVLSVQPPHNPYAAPRDYMQGHNMSELKLRPNVPDIERIQDNARRDLAGYYAQIENLDCNIGRIMDILEEEGLAANTHIIYFSDHGDMHGSHGQFKKMTPHEESIRIPFIIGGEKLRYSPRRVGRFPVPINHVDIAPTTLGLCGIEKPDWMEGTDYSHYRIEMDSSVVEPDSAFIQSVIPTGHHDSIDRPWRGIGWKYVCFEGVPWLMFNLNEDPYEQVNLSHNSLYRKERKRLNDRLKQWIIDTEDTFQLPKF